MRTLTAMKSKIRIFRTTARTHRRGLQLPPLKNKKFLDKNLQNIFFLLLVGGGGVLSLHQSDTMRTNFSKKIQLEETIQYLIYFSSPLPE